MIFDDGFKLRGFVSWLVTLTGLVMIASGVVAYIMPEGRIAYWVDWRFLTLGKAQWGTIHTVIGFLFIVTSCVHLAFNFKALVAYLQDRIKKTYSMRSELVGALLITIICTHGSIAGVPPFTTIMDLGSSLKKSWFVGEDVHPPLPHAELMTLQQLAGKMDLDLDGVLAFLREIGFKEVTAKSTLKTLAARTELSPAQIFEALMMDDRVYP